MSDIHRIRTNHTKLSEILTEVKNHETRDSVFGRCLIETVEEDVSHLYKKQNRIIEIFIVLNTEMTRVDGIT